MKHFSLVMLFCVLTTGCHKKPEPLIMPTKVTISRVLMHEPGRYTFLVPQEQEKIGQLTIQTSCGSQSASIYADVSKDETMWIVFTCGQDMSNCKPIPKNFSSWYVQSCNLAMHLHTANDIGGAGWNHGKFGHDQTVVVE